jgi:hypothetical protein
MSFFKKNTLIFDVRLIPQYDKIITVWIWRLHNWEINQSALATPEHYLNWSLPLCRISSDSASKAKDVIVTVITDLPFIHALSKCRNYNCLQPENASLHNFNNIISNNIVRHVQNLTFIVKFSYMRIHFNLFF